MIIWINGAFGSGKTTAAFELNRRVTGSFVYDPENVGYFIRKNAPPSFSRSDFQDIPLWREMNFKLLKAISQSFSGVIIVPMTLVKPQYFDEIVTKLRDNGEDVRHYILYAKRETILKRLRLRSASILNKESFAVKSIDRCIHSFDNLITETKIMTDDMSIDRVVEEIARLADITLPPDRRSPIHKLWDRAKTLVWHIRV